MSGDADKDLMEAVLCQIDGKIDYQILTNDLGPGSRGISLKALSRFKKAKLFGGMKKLPATAKVMKAPIATPPKTPNGTRKKGKASKKRKLATSDDEDEDFDLKIKEDEDADGGVNWDEAVQETPSRRLPARKARVLCFKEGLGEGEDDQHGEDFADSR